MYLNASKMLNKQLNKNMWKAFSKLHLQESHEVKMSKGKQHFIVISKITILCKFLISKGYKF